MDNNRTGKCGYFFEYTHLRLRTNQVKNNAIGMSFQNFGSIVSFYNNKTLFAFQFNLNLKGLLKFHPFTNERFRKYEFHT